MMDIVDHVTKCQIDPAVGGNELTTLSYLSVGLHHLYENVMVVEKPLRERDEKNDVLYEGYRNIPRVPQETLHLLQCYFHWYGVSLINYARVVGFLCGLSSSAFTRQHLKDEKRYQRVRKHCDDYVNSVKELSAVKVWRHKVAAHVAITARSKDDNPASLDFSAMYPVDYTDGRFRVGDFKLVQKDGAGRAHIGQLPRWSLTETHELLRQRYWPEGTR